MGQPPIIHGFLRVTLVSTLKRDIETSLNRKRTLPFFFYYNGEGELLEVIKMFIS